MPFAFTRDFKMVQTGFPFCYLPVSWWDGEYEGTCSLREDHPPGIHWDGISWFSDDRNPIELDDETEQYIISIYGAPGGLTV